MNLLRKPLVAAALTLVAALPIATLSATAETSSAVAQAEPAARITAAIDSASRVPLLHSMPPLATSAHDLGAVNPSLALHGISIVFSRSAAQAAALQTLIAAQQNPASPQYHQWLTPDQFAAQFGMADSDIAATEAWLQQQGFTIDSVARSRNRISFSGTASQVEAAFGAPLHHFSAPDGTTYFAPAADLTLPAALSSTVLSVGNLSSLRLKPYLKLAPARSVAQSSAAANPLFTSSVSGSHTLQPGDLAVMYDIKAVYSAGYTGVGQSIAVVGQSAVLLNDIAAFQSAAGISAKTPINVLVPNSGVSTVFSGDEAESDLDLEYSSTIAPGAQVYFVYTGDNSNLGVFQSLEYAVVEDIAPIISISYGGCEAANGTSTISGLDAFLQQGTAQGQTILASSGDSGSTGCYGEYATGSANNYVLAVDYPASSPYVTGMGGTEIPTAASAASNSTYFTATSGTDVVTSLKSYVPEQVWNDDVAVAAPDAGGGGVSTNEPRPTWQAGTFGGVTLAAGTTRLVPDISLVASNYSAPLLFCTSDSTAWNTAANGGSAPYQVASCNSGFRDASSQDLTGAGGTSFDGPIFAGMLALINQARQSNGQGNINPTLYSLAGNATTYATAFHDITTGGNQCLASASVCGTGTQTTNYVSATGYDEASGLGSIDLFNLLSAWPAATTTGGLLNTTTVTVTPASAAINYGSSDTVTVTVAQYGGTVVTPSGTVNLVIDGTSVTTLTLVGGTASYTYTPTNGGAHIVLAKYTGDATHAASSASGTFTVNAFTLAATNPTITSGGSGTTTLTLTPIGTFTGAVTLTIANYSSNLTNLCLSGSGTMTIAAAGVAATEPLTLYTSATTCSTNGLTAFTRSGAGKGAPLATSRTSRASAQPAPPAPGGNNTRRVSAAAALACLLLTFGLRRRKLARAGLALGCVVLLSFCGLGLTGCSNNAAGAKPIVTNTSFTPTGTYTIILGAQDTLTGDAVASTTVTVTVQ